MIISSCIHVAANGIILFFSWLSSIHVPHLLYPLLCCKWSNWQEINLQNMQTTHEAGYQSKTNNPIKNRAEDLNRRFSKEEIQWPKSTWKDAQLKRSLTAREMHIKITRRYITSHQSEWPSSRNLQRINAGEGVKKAESTYTLGRNVNWYSHYAEGSLKN